MVADIPLKLDKLKQLRQNILNINEPLNSINSKVINQETIENIETQLLKNENYVMNNLA